MKNKKEHIELNRQKWDSWAKSFDRKIYDIFRFMQKRTISLTALKEKDYFLDIGCGTGWAVRRASSIVKGNGKAFGIDLSPKMIEMAKANSLNNQNVFFLQAVAENLPFEDSFFEFIICTNSEGEIYILDVTTDGFLARVLDKGFQKTEREHVKYYSTQEFKDFYANANLVYIASKLILPFVKLHIAKK
ncbi:MAG: class I SAM-dependent methyltransferase [Candidatus Falkowbacteria bacterium]|nr:class I SAM-dependent methyltransferase [Candidatus Falkowbacteria bacterium]